MSRSDMLLLQVLEAKRKTLARQVSDTFTSKWVIAESERRRAVGEDPFATMFKKCTGYKALYIYHLRAINFKMEQLKGDSYASRFGQFHP